MYQITHRFRRDVVILKLSGRTKSPLRKRQQKHRAPPNNALQKVLNHLQCDYSFELSTCSTLVSPEYAGQGSTTLHAPTSADNAAAIAIIRIDFLIFLSVFQKLCSKICLFFELRLQITCFFLFSYLFQMFFLIFVF